MDKEEKEKLYRYALHEYSLAQQCDESFLAATFHQGLMHRQVHEYHEALKQFTKVQMKLPKDKTVYYERGLVYQMMGNHILAIGDF